MTENFETKNSIDFLGIFTLPEYSLNALINDNWQGLTEEDQKNIKAFNKKYNKPWIEISKNQDPFFSYNPEFGLACNCIECNVFVTVE